MLIYADELLADQSVTLGQFEVTHDAIVAFAEVWDAQDHHLVMGSESATEFGGIIASGAHTFAILQKLSVEAAYRDWAVVAGRAVRNLEFLRPVRSGDIVTGELCIQDVSPISEGRSLVVVEASLRNSVEVVLIATIECYVRRRPPRD